MQPLKVIAWGEKTSSLQNLRLLKSQVIPLKVLRQPNSKALFSLQ